MFSSTAAVKGCWRSSIAASVSLALYLPGPAMAQQQGPATASEQAREEIVVTARRRGEESIQEVPISIQAFSAEDLELSNIDAGRDVSILVPNLVIAGGGGNGQIGGTIRIRGVPGVGVYLDGIWQGTTGVLQTNLVEMQRVEVLRGPQGTLFGRNTNGGAIQYITQPPGPQFSSNWQLTVGSLNQRDVKGSVNIPLGAKLFTKWTAANYQRDGYLKLVGPMGNGRRLAGRDDQVLRGDILWLPRDDFSLRFTAFDGKQKFEDGRQSRISDPNNVHLRALNVLMTMPGTHWPAPAFGRANYESGHPGGVVGEWETRAIVPEDSNQIDSRAYTATLTWDISENMSLRSLTGYRERSTQNLRSSDAADFGAWGDDQHFSENEQFSQELHLTGSLFNDKVGYIAGLYYSDEQQKDRTYEWIHMSFYKPGRRADGLLIAVHDMDRINYVRAWGRANNDRALANYNPNASWQTQNSEWDLQDIQDRAVFGELNWRVNEKLEVTGGVRWSSRDFESRIYGTGPNDAAWTFELARFGGGHGPGNIFGGSLRSVETQPDLGWHFTPKLSLSYAWTPDVNTYLSYAEGYSQGSVYFNNDLQRLITLEPEVVKSYEVGIKSEWFDDDLRINASYFTSDWEGLRVSRHPPDPNNPGQTLPNPYQVSDGLAEVEGAEVEIAYRLTESFQLNLNSGWLDTAYVDIGDPSVSSLRFGRPFAYAPEWSHSGGLQYDRNLRSGGRLTLRTDYGWMSHYERDAAFTRQPLRGPEPSYGLLSARVRYVAPSANWSVSLHGTNLTDERYVDSGFDSRGPSGLDLNTIGPPRMYGVTVQLSFE